MMNKYDNKDMPLRGQVMSLKDQEFMLAARATGVSPANHRAAPGADTLGPVIVYATLTIPSVMLLEAFLSFLGLGVQAPLASWGSLAARRHPEHRRLPVAAASVPGVTWR